MLIDPERLKAYGLSIKTVAACAGQTKCRISRRTHHPGRRRDGATDARRVGSVREFESIVVATNKGTPITVADIGRVEDGVVEPRTVARFDGKNAVSLILRKQSGTNTVATVDAVRERLSEVQKLLPAGVGVLITVTNQTSSVTRSMKSRNISG